MAGSGMAGEACLEGFGKVGHGRRGTSRTAGRGMDGAFGLVSHGGACCVGYWRVGARWESVRHGW